MYEIHSYLMCLCGWRFERCDWRFPCPLTFDYPQPKLATKCVHVNFVFCTFVCDELPAIAIVRYRFVDFAVTGFLTQVQNDRPSFFNTTFFIKFYRKVTVRGQMRASLVCDAAAAAAATTDACTAG